MSRPNPRLREFGLPSAPDNSLETDKTYLYLLKSVYLSPCFVNCPVQSLKDATENFATWLESDCTVEGVWLPSIDIELDLTIKRIEFIKICGNISKHNFTRMNVDAGKVQTILERHTTTTGKAINLGEYEAFLALPEFYEWFHINIFTYHSSAIAEFLNNIRWGIYNYLHPEFERAIVRGGDGIGYSFAYPNDVQNPFARNMYWDLMNGVRGEPYMPQFEVTRFLKMRY